MIVQEATISVGAVLVGLVAPFGPPGGLSGIVKAAASGAVGITLCGLDGDEQADRRHHGGPEKAVHHYAFDHYPAWRREIGSQRLEEPGAFGENISTVGLTEADVCVGDIWRVGTALLQISQARQPCFKLNHRFGVIDMARRVQGSRRTGWYYRVVEPGAVAAGDVLNLVERPHADWPLARLLNVFYGHEIDAASLSEITGLESLSPSWRALAAKRLERGAIEDQTLRLNGSRTSPA